MAFFHLNHRPIGKATHRAGFAAAHLRYILRECAVTLALGDLPGAQLTTSDAARWFNEREDKARANGRIADRVVLALPVQLDHAMRANVVRDFVSELDPAGRIPWVAGIHDSEEDADNPHAHVMLIDADRETGKRVLLMSERGSTERLRTAWENVVNRTLKREGVDERVDRRTLRDQGIVDRIATIHVGPERGRPEIRAQREQINAEIGAANARLAEVREAEKLAQDALAAVQQIEAELRALKLAREQQREEDERRRRELERAAAEREPGIRQPDRPKWQLFREQLLSEAYATDLQGSDLARFWRISRGSAGELIFDNGNGRLVDVGERVSARDGNDVEIRGLLDVVRAKGWETVEFTGEDSFKRRAMVAAIRRGISVYADGSDRRLLADAEAVFAKERRLATPAKVGIGNRYVGPIEAIVGDVVLQRVDGGELVAHDRASFGKDRADYIELAIGKEMAIGYEFDGPTLETVELDLEIEL